MNRLSGESALRYARVCGWLYLIVIAGGIFGLSVTSRLVVSGDAAATADRILASESLWRLGFVGTQVAGIFYLPVTLILYFLLKPAGRRLSLLAAFFSLVGCAIGAIGALGQIAPLLVLKHGKYLETLDIRQLQTVALLFLKLSGNATDISLVYFGLYCISIGYLIFTSGYLPRFLGVLLVLGGMCYIVDSLAGFVAPTFERTIRYASLLSGLAELALCLWLIVRGVDAAKWAEASDGADRALNSS